MKDDMDDNTYAKMLAEKLVQDQQTARDTLADLFKLSRAIGAYAEKVMAGPADPETVAYMDGLWDCASKFQARMIGEKAFDEFKEEILPDAVLLLDGTI